MSGNGEEQLGPGQPTPSPSSATNGVEYNEQRTPALNGQYPQALYDIRRRSDRDRETHRYLNEQHVQRSDIPSTARLSTSDERSPYSGDTTAIIAAYKRLSRPIAVADRSSPDSGHTVRQEYAPVETRRELNYAAAAQTSSRSPAASGSKDAENGSPDNDESFYWHSSNSSTEITNDQKQPESNGLHPPTTGVTEEKPPPYSPHEPGEDKILVQGPNLYESAFATYNSSALGFGGPSDWEHFGDYEAEDIDDTELYTRGKSNAKGDPREDSAELPARTSVFYHNRSDGILDQAAPEARSQPAPPPPAILVYPQSAPLEDAEQVEYPIIQNQHPNTDPHGDNVSMLSFRMDQELPQSNPGTQDPGPQVNLEKETNPGSQDSTRFTPRNTDQGSEVNAAQEAVRSLQESINSTSGIVNPDSTAIIEKDITCTPPTSKHRDAQDKPESILGNPISQDTGTDFVINESPRRKDSESDADLNVDTPPSLIEENDPPDTMLEPSGKQTEWDAFTTSNAAEGEPSTQLPPLDQNGHGANPMPNGLTPEARDDDSNPPSAHMKNYEPRVLESDNMPEAGDFVQLIAGLEPWAVASVYRYVTMLKEEAYAESIEEKLTVFDTFTEQERHSRECRRESTKETSDIEHVDNNETFNEASSRSKTISDASKALPALPVQINPEPLLEDTATTNQKSQEPTPTVDEMTAGPSIPRKPLRSIEADTAVPNGDHGSQPLVASSRDANSQSAASAYPARRRSAYKTYAANRLSLAESIDDKGYDQLRKDLANKEQEESFLKFQNSEAFIHPQNIDKSGKQIAETNAQAGATSHRPISDHLFAVLPHTRTNTSDSNEIEDLRSAMDAIPDDFSFIHERVVAWDTESKNLRAQHDKDRHARQTESERHIDDLFNDNEIGYGDISELEAEFKRSEAARKADEDRLEYQTFVSGVFDTVWARLTYEINQLSPMYDECTNRVNDTLVGGDMFEDTDDRLALAPIMDIQLALHQKLEIRHQKAFEAMLERDRRLKKTEVAPCYTDGNIAKVKQLEKRFENAERKAILEFCRRRVERANKLMDVLDHNTLRGVGANQDYMEAIMKAVRTMAMEKASNPGDEPEELETLVDEAMKARMITTALGTSSEQIVQTYHVADMLLNAADYEVSVASAKLVNSDVAIFKRLREEKGKEDEKLVHDLGHRLSMIREDSRRTHDEIAKLLALLEGQAPGPDAAESQARPAAEQAGDEEQQHQVSGK